MSVLNRQGAQTAAAVCDDHDCPRIERDVGRSQDLKHTRSNRLGSLIARPDQNHTRDTTATGGQEVTEIQIACENDPLLPDRLGQDLIVRHGMETLFAKVHDLFACFT